MASERWKKHVLPHEDLAPIAPRLWQVTGTLPRMTLRRNMAVYELDGGGTLLHSPIALDEARMEALERIGAPKVIIVPSRYHRLDAGVFRERYPDAAIVCPAAARSAVESRVKVDASCEEALRAHGVEWHAIDGVRPVELAYDLHVGDGRRALVFCDLLFNVRDHLPGFPGLVMRYVTRSTGHFGVTRIARVALVKRVDALRGWLREQGQRRDLAAVLVAHGDAVTDGCAERLAEAARKL